VSDTGVGMSKGVVAQAFDSFFTTKDVGRGTVSGSRRSLASWSSRRTCHAVQQVGSGTTIKLYLPRLAGTENQSSVPAPEASGMPTGISAEWILVAEDDEDVRANATRQLRELG
jgi:hypothetical protein